MKVNEAIENVNNFIVVKNGKILTLKNEGKKMKSTHDNVLNLEVEKINIIKGLYADYTQLII